MSTWLEQGVYRLLRVGKTIDGEEVHWSSEDKEFKAVYEAITLEMASKVAPQTTNVLSVVRPRAIVAIFDCGITTKPNAFFNARIAREKFVAEYVAKPAEKQTEARQRLEAIKSQQRPPTEVDEDRRVVNEQEQKIAALEKAKKDNQARRSALVTEKRSASSERQGIIATEITAIDRTQKEITEATKAANAEQAYTAAKGRLDLEKRELENAEATYDQSKAGNHGTFCAARAAWGAEDIHLVDVRLGFGHSAGNNNPKDWQDALAWALDDGELVRCHIASCSVLFRGDGMYLGTNGDKKLGDFVEGETPTEIISDRPNVLFLGTAGNSPKLVENAKRGSEFAPAADHVLLVAGCTADGKLNAISSFGDVDVYAPNSYSPQYAPDSDQKGGGTANDKLDEITVEGLKLQPVDDFSTQEPDTLMDYGVSFGLPMVANVAAKCLLINPYLTPAEIKQVIVTTARETDRQTRTPKVGAAQTVVVKMMDPVAAYNEAARLRRART